MSLQVTALRARGEVSEGDSLVQTVTQAIDDADISPSPGDIVTVCSKIASKAEGRQVEVESVKPTPHAASLAAICGKDPKLVQLILDESVAVSRVAPGVLITRHRLGFVSANAGIDASNVHQIQHVLLLPKDPARSATALYDGLLERYGFPIPVIITDSHGRPFRRGTTGIALACVGMNALVDHVGRPDRNNRVMEATETGLADQIATAADMMAGQGKESTPIVWVRGLDVADQFQAVDERTDTLSRLLRDPAHDLYA